MDDGLTEAMTTAMWDLFDVEWVEEIRGASSCVDLARAVEAPWASAAVVELVLAEDMRLFDVVPGLADRGEWMASPISQTPIGGEPLDEEACRHLEACGAATWSDVLFLDTEELLRLASSHRGVVENIITSVVQAAWLLADGAAELCPHDSAVAAFEEEEELRELVLEVTMGTDVYRLFDLGAEGGNEMAVHEAARPRSGFSSRLALGRIFPVLTTSVAFTSRVFTWAPEGVAPLSSWTLRLLADFAVHTWADVLVLVPSEMVASRLWHASAAADLGRFLSDVQHVLTGVAVVPDDSFATFFDEAWNGRWDGVA